MPNNLFSTARFEDIEPARIQQTNLPKSQAEFSSGAVATLAKITDAGLDTLAAEKTKKKTAEAEEQFQATIAAGKVFAEEHRQSRDPASLLDREAVLKASIARELGTDVDINDPRISSAIKDFEKLALAKEGKRLLDDQFRMLATSKMKSFINSNPGFRDEIKATAKAVFGFDPTSAEAGAVLRSLAGIGKEKVDLVEEEYQKFNAKHPGVFSKPEWIEWSQKQFQSQQELAKIEEEAKLSNFSASRAARAVDLQYGLIQNEVLGRFIESGGQGINDAEISAIASQKMNAIMTGISSQPGLRNLTLTDRQKLQDLVASKITSLKAMIEDGSLKEIATKKQQTMSALLKNQVFNDAHIATIYSIGGGEKLIDYLGVLAEYGDDPAIWNALKRINPDIAALENLGTFANTLAIANKKINDGKDLSEDESIVFGLATKANIANPSSTTAGEDTIKSRQVLGDINTLSMYDNNKAVLATAKDPKQKEALNNMFESMAGDIVLAKEKIERALDPRVKLTVEDTISREKSGGVAPFRHKKVVLDTSAFKSGFFKRQAEGLLEEELSKINMMLKITARYGKHGLLRSVKSEQDILDLLFNKEEEKKKEETK